MEYYTKKMFDNYNFIHPDEIPELLSYGQYSDVLLAKDSSSNLVIAFYNKHEKKESSGYYRSPNFDQPLEILSYIIAPNNLVVRCKICDRMVKRDKLIGSHLIEELNRQMYPCCPKCKNCNQFEYGYLTDEEE